MNSDKSGTTGGTTGSTTDSTTDSDTTGSMDGSSAPETHNQTRTRIHMAAAALGAAFLIVAALTTPRCTQFMSSRQVQAIQYGVASDLELMMRAEKRFFEKHGFYTTDLRLLLYPDYPKVMVYKVGFVKPSKAVVIDGVVHDPTVSDFDRLKEVMPNIRTKLSPVTKIAGIETQKLASYCPDCTATATGFKLVAAANLDEDPVLDVWTIDEKGVRQHLVDDLNQ